MPRPVMPLPAISLAVRISSIGTVILLAVIAGIVIVTLRDIELEMHRQATDALTNNVRLLKQTLSDEGGSSTFKVLDGKLSIGSHIIDATEPAVDRVRDIMGGTATVFQGDKRVATNVVNTDGSRAVGTTLAPGPVRDTVLGRGETYRGEAVILGIPYLTIYEPIRDARGNVIGIFYAGVKKSEYYRLLDRIRDESFMLGIAMALAGAAILWLSLRRAVAPLRKLDHAMRRLATGDVAVGIPGTDRRDEIGAMAAAVQVFKENLIHTRRLEEDTALARASAEEQRRTGMRQMADRFEAAVGGIVGMVSASATELQATAQTMTATATETAAQSTAVAAAAEEASANVGTVAAAAEELGASVQEIGRQVDGSARLAQAAVAEAGQTAHQVDAAEAAAEEPGRREQAAMLALIAGRPTTATGLWALTAYLPQAVRQVSPDPGTEAQAALDALRESALQLGLAPAAAELCDDRPEEWITLDTRLISLARELGAIEAEQAAILKAGSYADAYDAPDWVRLEEHRESILQRIIAIRAHTLEGLKAKASLFDLESVKGLEQPSRDLSRSIMADLASIDVTPSAEAHPDAALLALGMPFLAAWRDEGAADPCSTAERRAGRENREAPAGGETFDAAHARCSALANRIAALPAATVEGLGIKALALACYSTDNGSPAGPMPEPDASSTASDDALLWQIQAGAARILASDAGTSLDTPANAAAAPAEQPAGPAATSLDLSGYSVPQLARLYEVFQAAYDHLSALGQLPCFLAGHHAFNPAGEIIEREADRLGAMVDDCVGEIARRDPAPGHEQDDALRARVVHELRCNGGIDDPALMRDLVRSWGENGHIVPEAGR